MSASIGFVEVVLYASLRGAEPIEVGVLRLPLTLKSVATGTIECQLSEALEFVAEDLKAVFGKQDGGGAA